MTQENPPFLLLKTTKNFILFPVNLLSMHFPFTYFSIELMNIHIYLLLIVYCEYISICGNCFEVPLSVTDGDMPVQLIPFSYSYDEGTMIS